MINPDWDGTMKASVKEVQTRTPVPVPVPEPPALTVERLAELLAECPTIYTTDDYGATDPADFESAPYYRNAAAWLLPRLGTVQLDMRVLEPFVRAIEWLGTTVVGREDNDIAPAGLPITLGDFRAAKRAFDNASAALPRSPSAAGLQAALDVLEGEGNAWRGTPTHLNDLAFLERVINAYLAAEAAPHE